MSAPKAFRNGPLSSPPRNKASSMRMFQARSVRTTRSWAGALPRDEGLAQIQGIGGEKQMRIERRHVGIGVLSSGKGRARDVELVVLDRVHDPHPRVGGVA